MVGMVFQGGIPETLCADLLSVPPPINLVKPAVVANDSVIAAALQH